MEIKPQKIKCDKCGEETLRAQYRYSCSDCVNNGYILSWSESLWGYDEDKRRLRVREQAEVQGRCRIGKTENAGCMEFICTKCGNHFNFEFSGGC